MRPRHSFVLDRWEKQSALKRTETSPVFIEKSPDVKVHFNLRAGKSK